MSVKVSSCAIVGLLLVGCSGPYVMEEATVRDGMVVGTEDVAVDGSGKVTAVDQEGYVGDNRYLDDYETDDDNLGPNAPGYIP